MKIGDFLKQKKLHVFFLIYIILLIPFASIIADNLEMGTFFLRIAASACLVVIILLLSSFMSTKHLRIFYSAIALLALVPGAVLLGYLLFAKVILTEGSIAALFETNPSEAKEFIVSYMNPWVVAGIVLYILFPFMFIFKMENNTFFKISEHKKIFTVCIISLLLFLTVEPLAHQIYFIDFYRVFARYEIQKNHEIKAIAQRQDIPFDVTLSENNAPQTIVIVIGESLSRHHMSLYGYERNTNPLLADRNSSELIVYKDVVSPHVHTIPALRSIITFADDENPQYLIDRPSLFELFNRAGYETSYITNQPFDKSNSSYKPLLKLANKTYDLSNGNQPDEVLLNTLQESLNTATRKLVVVHLLGSHTAYKYRYPSTFEYYNFQKEPISNSSDYMNVTAKKIVDEYDNSVRYNDFLIDSILKMMENKKESSAFIYFSDHGEEVYDYRDFAGHAYEKVSTYMCEVPFMVWLSENFKDRRTDLVFNPEYSFSTIDFLYSLSDLAGLTYKGYDATRSIFSPEFITRERKIGSHSYESVIEMTKGERKK